MLYNKLGAYTGTIAQAKERFETSLENPDAAFEQVKHWSSAPVHDPPSKAKFGAKKKPILRSVQPLPGKQMLKTDEKIRAVEALLNAGFSKARIEKMLGMSAKYTNDLAVRHPQAVDAARADIVKNAMVKYQDTMPVVVGALSDAAPIAMRTFVTLLEHKDTSPSVRFRAAHAVMQMFFDAGRKRESSTAENIHAIGDVIASARKESGIDKYIIDVEAEPENEA